MSYVIFPSVLSFFFHTTHNIISEKQFFSSRNINTLVNFYCWVCVNRLSNKPAQQVTFDLVLQGLVLKVLFLLYFLFDSARFRMLIT